MIRNRDLCHHSQPEVIGQDVGGEDQLETVSILRGVIRTACVQVTDVRSHTVFGQIVF